MTLPVSAAGPAGPAALTTGRNGELRQDHPYISAVVMLHHSPTGVHHAHTFLTHSAAAVPLPPAFFAGQDDLVFDYGDGHYSLRQRG